MFATFCPGVVAVPVMWTGGATVPAGWPTCRLPRCNTLVCVDLNSGFRSNLCLKHYNRALRFQEQAFARHPHNRQQMQRDVPLQRRFRPEQHDWSDDESKDEELANEAGQDLLRAVLRETDTMVFFWRPPCTFSQWVPSTFYVDDVRNSFCLSHKRVQNILPMEASLYLTHPSAAVFISLFHAYVIDESKTSL